MIGPSIQSEKQQEQGTCLRYLLVSGGHLSGRARLAWPIDIGMVDRLGHHGEEAYKQITSTPSPHTSSRKMECYKDAKPTHTSATTGGFGTLRRAWQRYIPSNKLLITLQRSESGGGWRIIARPKENAEWTMAGGDMGGHPLEQPEERERWVSSAVSELLFAHLGKAGPASFVTSCAVCYINEWVSDFLNR